MQNLMTEKFLFDDNKEHLISEFKKEKGYIFYFFPKAETPGCTLETIAYNKHYQEILAQGYNVIGISRDNPKKQNKFKCNHDITFPMVCDIDERLCNMFKVLKEKKLFNNKFMGVVRSTFLLDNNFKILKEWRDVQPVEHIKIVLEEIKK